MELQKFLIKAIKKRFIANATVKALEKKVEQTAEQTIFKKYRSEILFADGLEFELEDVKASFSNWQNDLTLVEIDLELVYFCTSKLPKAKREKLEKVKAAYKKEKHLEWNNYKVELWKEVMYTIDIESVLSGNINLSIN